MSLLAITSAGWFLISKWLASAKRAAIEAYGKAEAPGGKRTIAGAAQIERELALITRFQTITGFATVLPLAAALLSFANVIIAIPLALIAVLAILAQVICIACSYIASKLIQTKPAVVILRRAFGMAFFLGMAYPILLLIIARQMIEGRG